MALESVYFKICTNFRMFPISYQSVRTFKSDLKIKWVRPEKVSCIKPEKSGDLKSLEPLDMSQYILQLQNSKELETGNEWVRRRFSLEFNRGSDAFSVIRKNYVDSVKRHQLDKVSYEVRIAGMTAKIRQLQEHMEKHPRDKANKVILKEMIEKRWKELRKLRACDYKRYEWVLEKLDLIFKLKPEIMERVERKRSLRKLTDLHCEELRGNKMNAYKNELLSQQEEFLQTKAEKLKWIMEVEKKLEIEPSVTQKDIDEVHDKLNMLKLDISGQSES